MSAVASFLHNNRWIEMQRDPDDESEGMVRWEMDPKGELRTRLDGKDDVRAFSGGLVIRGFDLAGGLPLTVVTPVEEPTIDYELHNGGQ